MITNTLKKELFSSNLEVMGEVVKDLAKNIEEIKKYLADKKNSDESNLNAVIGGLISMPQKLKQLEDMKNVMEAVHLSK